MIILIDDIEADDDVRLRVYKRKSLVSVLCCGNEKDDYFYSIGGGEQIVTDESV